MKRILSIYILLLVALAASAGKARPGIRNVKQPDGSTVKVTLTGDEFHHYYLSEEGYPLMVENGFFYFANVNEEGRMTASPFLLSEDSASQELQEFLKGIDREKMVERLSLRRERNSNARLLKKPSTRSYNENDWHRGLFPNSTYPTFGSPRVIVILAEFADKKMTLENPHDYFHRLLNEEGFSDYCATGSVLDYFKDSSAGIFIPEFDIYGPVTLPKEMAYYGENDKDGNDKHAVDMIVQACEALDDEVDFSLYDCDGDGYIDNVFVFYAGEGEASSEDKNTIWPHSWNVSYGIQEEKKLDGVILDRYACSNEWVVYGGESYPDGGGSFIHEFSHVMGLPDLYSTSNSTSYTPGEWSVMDVGSYNNNGYTPPLYSAFERYALGWLEPFEMTEPALGTLRPIIHNEAGIIRTKDAEGALTPDEFFLVENRQQEGWDSYLPGHGMLVWHVDYNEDIWWNNEVNNNSKHQYVDLVEAAGELISRRTRAADPFPGEKNKKSFTETTKPAAVSWAGVPCGVAITDISEDSGIISFKLNGDGENPNGPNAIEGVEADDVIKWRCENGTVLMEGFLPSTELTVYDITGKSVITLKTDADGTAKAALPPSGLYILRTPSAVLKIKI